MHACQTADSLIGIGITGRVGVFWNTPDSLYGRVGGHILLHQIHIRTICGHDKVNQLRHVRFFKDIHGMVEHMRKHANILRPKFEAVENILDRELGGLEIGTWTKPHGGYFISFDSLNGCAKEIVARCKKAGVVMTGAGATYPYGKDPEDRNIRIAPSYPPLQDLIIATELFALCVKLVSVNKLLEEM